MSKVIIVDKSTVARVMVEIVNQTAGGCYSHSKFAKYLEQDVREICRGKVVYDLTNNDQLLELDSQPIELDQDLYDVMSDESVVFLAVTHVPEDQFLDEYTTYHMLYWRAKAEDLINDEETVCNDADFVDNVNQVPTEPVQVSKSRKSRATLENAELENLNCAM